MGQQRFGDDHGGVHGQPIALEPLDGRRESLGAAQQLRGALGPVVFPLLCGVAAVLGHSFTIWLRFKGGKGVATAAGMFAALAPQPLLCSVATFVTLVGLTRYVSLASMVSAFALNLFIVVLTPESKGPLCAIALPLAFFITWRHRDNIRRLLAGTEAKLGAGPKATPADTAADAGRAS